MQTFQPQSKKFQRNIEDFECVECKTLVIGDGYRNHCPKCLVSVHVDKNPGDRAEKCKGVMDIIDISLKHGELVIMHKCRKCGHQKPNKAHPEDSMDKLVEVMKLKASS